tara:strand:+ start:44 stop:802 length:759 start_codon:yes stop_codon:yes gene_type:complete
MKAHQRIMREKIQKEEQEYSLLGKYWEQIDIDISKAEVKKIDLGVAKKIIEKYEWLKCLSAINKYQFGIFFDNVCAGVVVYGTDYAENLGHWDKYGFTGKILLLNRGACVHWAHPHSASKLISQSMKMLPKKYEVITATVDDLAGEIGTIYQACNFYYIGSMRDANPKINSKKGDRCGWLINNKLYGSRAIRSKFGTTKIEIIKQAHPDVKKVKQNSKGRYFYFRGTKTQNKKHLKSISHLIKTYPKRNYIK